MREELRDRDLRDRRMEALDMLPDTIVEAEPAVLAKLHDAGSGEALRMGGHTKTVPRRQRLSADEIGEAEGPLKDDPGFVSNGNHTAWLLRIAQLVFEPLRDVVESGLHPVIHVLPLSGR